MSKRKNSPAGMNWNEFEKEIFSQEEIETSNVRVALMLELLEAREKKGMSQAELEKQSGVKQPVISRLEKGTTDPQLSTVIRVLRPLEKTIAIVPLNEDKSDSKEKDAIRI